ncbi:hypothetical protein EDD37DRAFT_624124 [Exophiala viscosa]|uniref:uncharacterized protein n=1 Tax=Exophiala viscosa TaxID=2486360 RepID=UPI002194B001|nr:hypothetical protein EDD37DRAFT_624124 [Exophiala viscosa]
MASGSVLRVIGPPVRLFVFHLQHSHVERRPAPQPSRSRSIHGELGLAFVYLHRPPEQDRMGTTSWLKTAPNVSCMLLTYKPQRRSPPTDEDLTQLAVCLWAWQLCRNCKDRRSCSRKSCPKLRMKHLVPFFDHYRAWTGMYEADTGGIGGALTTHRDLLTIITTLQQNPDIPRAKLKESIFSNGPDQSIPPVVGQNRALNLAVRVSAMINCSALHQDLGTLEHGLFRYHWRDDLTYSQFISLGFPQTDHPNVNGNDSGRASDFRTEITARKLKKRAKLRFQPTDDLGSHLQFHRKTKTVDIYHHTTFLKEQLRLTRDDAVSHLLPRQLVLEALDTVQKVLFPLADRKSYDLLQTLVSRSGFDPDCLRFESTSIRKPEEKDITYHYFGGRLAELYEESKNPTPHSLLDKWLDRKSGARHVMFATLVGVLIAIVLGILSLAVSICQAYISYQAWKHPVPAPQ